MYAVRQRRRFAQGIGLVEFVIVLPVAILFVLCLVQAGFIYMAKLQVNHATFLAARMGAVHNADVTVMRNAMRRSLSPFYQNSFDTNDSTRLATGYANALAADLEPWRMEFVRVNPSPASFDDFGVRDPKTGVTYIPNDNLEWRKETLGTRSQQTLREANLLKLRVVYGYELKVPLMAGVLRRVMCGGASAVEAFGDVNALEAVYPGGVSGDCMKYYQFGRLPIESVAIVQMQSRAEM